MNLPLYDNTVLLAFYKSGAGGCMLKGEEEHVQAEKNEGACFFLRNIHLCAERKVKGGLANIERKPPLRLSSRARPP